MSLCKKLWTCMKMIGESFESVRSMLKSLFLEMLFTLEVILLN